MGLRVVAEADLAVLLEDANASVVHILDAALARPISPHRPIQSSMGSRLIDQKKMNDRKLIDAKAPSRLDSSRRQVNTQLRTEFRTWPREDNMANGTRPAVETRKQSPIPSTPSNK